MEVDSTESDAGSWLPANTALNGIIVFSVTLLTAWTVFVMLKAIAMVRGHWYTPCDSESSCISCMQMLKELFLFWSITL